MISQPEDRLADDLARLPAPAIDPALAAKVHRRARGALRDRGSVVRLDDAVVPALLLLAGIAYTVTSFELMLRIFTSA